MLVVSIELVHGLFISFAKATLITLHINYKMFISGCITASNAQNYIINLLSHTGMCFCSEGYFQVFEFFVIFGEAF